MVVAARDLNALLGRGENDNQPVRAVRPVRVLSEPALPSKMPVVRPDSLELDYPTLATRLEPEAKILWATMRHPERACFTPALMADGRHFQEWLKEESAAAAGPTCRSATWSGTRPPRVPGAWAATSRPSPA